MTMFRREKKNNWALINRVKYDGLVMVRPG